MSNIKLTSARSLLLTILAAFFVISGAWGQTFRVLHSFGASGDGLLPVDGQVFDRQGNLYGVTELGPLGNGCLGNEGCGTVYQLKPNGDGTWSESVIHAFNGSDAALPSAAPSFDPQGNLDGTADGHAGAGTFPTVVYQLSPASNGTWTESILYQFPSSPDSGPGALTFDPAGNIYGVTAGGGVNDAGSVYSLNRATGWQERLLLSFDGYPYRRGLSPQGAITFDANGNLYGSTILGGAYNCGVTYKLMRQGSLAWKETVLHDFGCGADGFYPYGATFGPDGSLYAVTQIGGIFRPDQCVSGCGTVFKLTPNPDGTWTKTTLYKFRGGPNDGAGPVDSLVFDQAGNIYSTTWGGGMNGCGTGCGTVFKLTPSAGGQWTESILHFFTGGSDGYGPIGNMAIDGAGNLYGATYQGGVYGYGGGVAYEITP
jgi:uncharacterized repeat protein (TIGR03803 family)